MLASKIIDSENVAIVLESIRFSALITDSDIRLHTDVGTTGHFIHYS